MSITHTRYVQDVYGIDRDEARSIPVEVQEIMAKLVLVIAAADGLSASEQKHFASWLDATGHPEALSRQLFLFEPAHADVDEMLQHWKALLERSVTPRLAACLRRALIYEGARIATACDGYSEAEKAMMLGICATLGLPASVVSAIEGLVDLELHIKRARAHALPASLQEEMEASASKVRRFLLNGG